VRAWVWIGAAIALGSSGCGGCGDDAQGGPDAAPDAAPITYADCDSDTASWVRNAYQAIVGHRPHGQAEVDVYVQLHDQIAQLVADGAITIDPKEAVARAMTEEPGYGPRWTSHFIDALRVARADEQNMSRCYDDRDRAAVGPELATYVRDNAATATGAGGAFTMLDLIESSLALDDVSPIYRGHLFALVSYPIPAANVPPVEAELARREDFGLIFDSAYLNRDLVCLQCHNSEFSVTDDADPSLDRHWPVDGLFEASLYGASSGIDPLRAHAPFRHDGFSQLGGGGRRPWGWNGDCGSFATSIGDDPAQVDGKFGDLTGERITVYELEASLRDGLEGLRGGAIAPGSGGVIENPDHAFAYLWAATVVEGVWKEVVGSGLTIANYFPRNQAMRDTLRALTDRFVASGYSLEDLLVAIVSSDYFSRQLPEQACGDGPYIYPNVYDPWVISDDDETRRLNGPGDAIAAVSTRTLMRHVFAALEWDVPVDINFPGGGEAGCSGLPCSELQQYCDFGFCCQTYQNECLGGGGVAVDEFEFQQGAGAFIKNGERGFRGLDFQARLVWEDRFGTCQNPYPDADFVDAIVAGATGDVTVSDVVVAVKDRLVGEPTVAAGAETTALEAMFGAALTAPASGVTGLEDKVRQLCGVLVSSPQFVLSGAAGRGGAVPALTPAEWQFDAVCADVGPRVADFGGSGIGVECAAGALTVTAPPAGP
jgi:hypothetical protein